MSKKYPRIGMTWKLRYPQGLCHVCAAPKADARIDVQFNYMRGDDEVYKVHSECIAAFKRGFPENVMPTEEAK